MGLDNEQLTVFHWTRGGDLASAGTGRRSSPATRILFPASERSCGSTSHRLANQIQELQERSDPARRVKRLFLLDQEQ